MNQKAKEQLRPERIPQSVAIIMDGNGRWAKARGMARQAGHLQGVETVNRITAECARLGVKYLTLYTFSTENWNRPQEEVDALMNLVATQLEDEIFMKNDVRFQLIGDMDPLPAHAKNRLRECIAKTAHNKTMTAVTALNYSSRWEITKAMQQAVEEAKAGKLDPEQITEEYISQHLETRFMQDPDLLIRTGGELRISNFLLWQCAYSEFYFTDKLWPDFTEEDLHKAFLEYQQRERRFGKTSEQVGKKQ